MNIKFIEKDRISQEACTHLWFLVDGKSEWALSVDAEGEVTLLDGDDAYLVNQNYEGVA